MSVLSPFGTARARFLRETPTGLHTHDPELHDVAYLGWEIARCAPGMDAADARALAALAAATLMAGQEGSTRVPLDGRLDAVLQAVGAGNDVDRVRGLVTRARAGDAPTALTAVLGSPGVRAPLVIEGDWIYAERMRVLESDFCARVRARVAAPVDNDARSRNKVLKAIAAGPPALTDEQKRAVRAALGEPLALVTGGPGTGKTTLVIAVLRALAWTGIPMETVAIAAPTGKAAQRLQQTIDAGLAGTAGDMADASLKLAAPEPQTLHRLLGWSPRRGRFARHENDPLPHRVVIVDEASMVDLAMMDRLLRALQPEARLVLLGDADQLPSIEAGAVFRDLCAALGATRMTANLRVARDPSAAPLVGAAQAVNSGVVDSRFAEAVVVRPSVAAVRFEGVEHIAAPWSQVGEALLERWWNERVATLQDFARRSSRTFQSRGGAIVGDDALELRALLDHHARSRILCATRVSGLETSSREMNARLLERLRGTRTRAPRWRIAELVAGSPVTMDRNDYERRLYNGDQGLVVRVEDGTHSIPYLSTVFPRRDGFEAFPVDALGETSAAFAMTVHKSQGSEFDTVALVLPEADMPMLTRELLYTAITRARRSVLIVGDRELLARAVARRVERHSGVADRLIKTTT